MKNIYKDSGGTLLPAENPRTRTGGSNRTHRRKHQGETFPDKEETRRPYIEPNMKQETIPERAEEALSRRLAELPVQQMPESLKQDIVRRTERTVRRRKRTGKVWRATAVAVGGSGPLPARRPNARCARSRPAHPPAKHRRNMHCSGAADMPAVSPPIHRPGGYRRTRCLLLCSKRRSGTEAAGCMNIRLRLFQYRLHGVDLAVVGHIHLHGHDRYVTVGQRPLVRIGRVRLLIVEITRQPEIIFPSGVFPTVELLLPIPPDSAGRHGNRVSGRVFPPECSR